MNALFCEHFKPRLGFALRPLLLAYIARMCLLLTSCMPPSHTSLFGPTTVTVEFWMQFARDTIWYFSSTHPAPIIALPPPSPNFFLNK